MRIPTSWNDRSLLQDEPFINWFYPAVPEIHKREKDVKNEVMKELKTLRDPKLEQIIKGWTKYAFVCAPGKQRELPMPEDLPTITLFVDFYLQLSRNEDKALKSLNRARNTRGFGPLNPNLTHNTIPTLPLRRPKVKPSASRSASQDSTWELRKTSDRQKRKEAVKNSFAPVNAIEPSESQTLKLRKTRSSLAPPSSRFSSKVHTKKGSKEHVVVKSTPLRNKQVPRDERVEITVNVGSSSKAQGLRRSTRHVEFPEERQRHSEAIDERIKSKKSKLPVPKSKRVPAKNNKADDIDDTLQVKQKIAIIDVARTSKKPEPQLSQKRPASQTIDLEPKRRRVEAKIVDESPTFRKGTGHRRARKTKKRKKLINHLEHGPANTSNIEQGVKVEDLTQHPSHSVLPLDDNLLGDNLPIPPLTSSHPTQPSVHGNIIEFHKPTLLPFVKSSPMPMPVPLEPRMASSIFDSVKVITTMVSELDVKSKILLAISSATGKFDFLSALQFRPEEPLTIIYKPPLPSLPPIWAQSRQEVCESFDWFRSYQGGVYHSHEIVKGYLLSGFPTRGDRFEHGGRLIISHGGGKSESIHSIKGHVSSQPASDQLAQDKSIRALLNNYKNNRPLALLVDDKYALFPYDLGAKDVTYAVLGFYVVEKVWAEYQSAHNASGRVVRYKFAFRWCEDQGPPWWIPNLAATESPTQPLMAIDDIPESRCGLVKGSETMPCEDCQQKSPRVFNAFWVCLNPDCRMFWRQAEGPYLGHFPFGDFSYYPKFLALPPYKPLPFGFREIVTSLPPTGLTISSRNYHFTRGFHCARCGRLSCRYQWEKWHCLNCNEILAVHDLPRQASDLWNQKLPISFKDYLVNPISVIVPVPPATFIHDNGRGIIRSFILPHRRGIIHHIQSGNANGRKEADLLFLEYQQQAASGTLKFRRWPLRAHKCRGPLLTNYFSHNAGEPYQYVGGDANTVPFESAPAVCKARDLIQKRIKQALGKSVQFNEVLSAAYMERQKMAFHSDDEIGLGPLVAGLSLGSPALMHFRLHARYDPDREMRGILLSIILRHGDVLVMDGADIQEYYEHTVVPNNFRIAATARQIGPIHHI